MVGICLAGPEQDGVRVSAECIRRRRSLLQTGLPGLHRPPLYHAGTTGKPLAYRPARPGRPTPPGPDRERPPRYRKGAHAVYPRRRHDQPADRRGRTGENIPMRTRHTPLPGWNDEPPEFGAAPQPTTSPEDVDTAIAEATKEATE